MENEEVSEHETTLTVTNDSAKEKSSAQDSSNVSTTSAIAVSNIWKKTVPKINNIFLVISLLLVFGLDLLILIGSPNLLIFWIEMLVVFGIFLLFYFIEKYVLAKKFSNKEKEVDSWFVTLAVFRNVILVLNFIPLIQIFGFILVLFLSIPYLIIYILLVNKRSKEE